MRDQGERELVFLKLGGSLITDKTRAYTVRDDTLGRLAMEIRSALDAVPDTRLLIGHGSGSYGHWAAKEYDTRAGVTTRREWRGFAEVGAAASRLNRIVTDVLLNAGIPVLSVQPSATAWATDGRLVRFDVRPLLSAMEKRLVPVVFGDICWDDVRGGTIISTEDIFLYLAGQMHPDRVLMLGEVPGILHRSGQVVTSVSPDDFDALQGVLGGSRGVDVTGGMTTKVARMLQLVRESERTTVQIASGLEPELLRRVLVDPSAREGTLVSASTSPGSR
ncbi:MAG: isopentenyl phosphate kinase family protein [Chloroflexi bacterium]|nr:isopentenyl phosphate kinase family protein [Chloroflexota bacterium]